MILLNLIVVLLWIVLYAFLAVLALVLVLCFAPFRGKVYVNSNHVSLKASYLFGAIRASYYSKTWQVRLFGFRLKMGEKQTGENRDDQKEKSEKSKKEKRKQKVKNLKKRGLPSRNIIVLTLKLIKKLIRKIAPRTCKLRLYVGLDDPYVSGLISMVTSLLFVPLNTVEGYRMQCIPLYGDLDLRVDAEVVFKCSIADLVIPCVRFVIRKPVRQYIWPKKEKHQKDNSVVSG